MPILKPIKGALFPKWLRHDLIDKAANLECHSCERFFTPSDIKRVMRNSYGHGLVITHLLDPIAYTLYLKNDNQAHLVNLVVAPEWRRQGTGTLLIDQIKKRVNRITAAVREGNLAAHLFLQDNGFVASNVLKNHFKDEYAEECEREDAYVFEFKEEQC